MICECGFKHGEESCPICGKHVDKPKKRYRYLKARSNGKTNMAELFRRYVEQRYPGYNGYSVECDNCGKLINELKFENISHTKGKGAHPDLACNPVNLKILCAALDYWGEKDNSCHTLWERKRFDEYHAKRQKAL